MIGDFMRAVQAGVIGAVVGIISYLLVALLISSLSVLCCFIPVYLVLAGYVTMFLYQKLSSNFYIETVDILTATVTYALVKVIISTGFLFILLNILFVSFAGSNANIQLLEVNSILILLTVAAIQFIIDSLLFALGCFIYSSLKSNNAGKSKTNSFEESNSSSLEKTEESTTSSLKKANDSWEKSNNSSQKPKSDSDW